MVIGDTCDNVTGGGGGRGQKLLYMEALEHETSCDHLLCLLQYFPTLLYLDHFFSDQTDGDDDNDDDDDDDDDDEFFVWLTDKRRLVLFPGGTIVRNLHHHEFPTCPKQDLNLRRT